MIDRDTLRQFDESFGTSIQDASASGDDAPNGNNFIGAINSVERLLEQCNEYELTYSDLPAEKQTELDEAVEDMRYHIDKLDNLTREIVGSDSSFELPNGERVDLPGSATSGKGPRGQS